MYTDDEKLKEIERELQMRKRYYPAMVAKGSLSNEQQVRQIAILNEVAEDYRTKVAVR